VPALQRVHADDNVGENVPARHCEHAADEFIPLPVEYVPAVQFRQTAPLL